ncbi:chaplin [Streptomyces sp. WMMC940]|uniref:chaplin n=1 Tax=Streptomyces sp. WMMC940 TaxID=3015153 RepID=UPI0022B60DAB|nr:chaplin family protein [Streptomyces sp. WMMC940]MCZ7459079.1 chaplin family protein [Streptomyces sp. WMMC940]
MRQVISKGILTAAAATGILSLTSVYASADSQADAEAANSPGVLSGNNVQAPVHVPVNVCGNSLNVVGVLNPAFGNACVNASDEGAAGSAGASADGAAVGSPGVASGNNVQVPVDIPVNACGNTIDVIGALNPAGGNNCGNGTAETPLTPEVPETPVTPESPEVPETPVTPESPEVPETPVTPESPETPETPEIPVTPEIPEVPEVPEIPEVPEVLVPVVDTPVDDRVVDSSTTEQLAQTGGNAGTLAAGAAAVGLLAGGALLYRRGTAAARR